MLLQASSRLDLADSRGRRKAPSWGVVVMGRPGLSSEFRGESVRLRLINTAASTPFRVATGAGPITVVATDGHGAQPVSADSLIVEISERYDVLVTAPARAVRAGASDARSCYNAIVASDGTAPKQSGVSSASMTRTHCCVARTACAHC